MKKIMEARVAAIAFATSLFKAAFTRRNMRIALFALIACIFASHYALAQDADSAAGVAAGQASVSIIALFFKSIPSWVPWVALGASELLGELPTQSNGVLRFLVNALKALLSGFKTKL